LKAAERQKRDCCTDKRSHRSGGNEEAVIPSPRRCHRPVLAIRKRNTARSMQIRYDMRNGSREEKAAADRAADMPGEGGHQMCRKNMPCPPDTCKQAVFPVGTRSAYCPLLQAAGTRFIKTDAA
jgi:hypothetical protein